MDGHLTYRLGRYLLSGGKTYWKKNGKKYTRVLIPVYLWAKESMGKIRGGTEGIFLIRIQKNGCRAAWQMRGWARGGEACVCGQHQFGLAGGGVRSYKQGQDGPRALVTASGGDPDLDQTEMLPYRGRAKTQT